MIAASMSASRRPAWPPIVVALALLLVAATSHAQATYYVRTDGGTARQCSGLVDRPRAEAGKTRDCAWLHPFVALPPGGKPRIAGGDHLVIRPGSYRIGIDAPGAACSRNWPWDCFPAALPSGSAERPTRLSGADDSGRCVQKPEWWGAERASRVLNLDGSQHVVVECLEITDHSSCIEGHCHGGDCSGQVLRCPREHFPYGDWASTGVYGRDSSDVVLRDLDVHGLASRGFQVGRVRDWVLQRVRIVGNGWAGWDGDLAETGGSSNAGRLRFEQVEIAWNGCAERYPDREPVGCWAQTSGGYGDGLGTAKTAGEWEFVDVHVHHNTSDGLDLLYMEAPGRVSVTRLRAEANAGNQFKVAGDSVLVDSTIDGRCDYFNGRDNMNHNDQCRALGNAVSVVLRPGTEARLRNNRITGVGDCLVVLEGGDASSRLAMDGNTLLGAPLWSDPKRLVCGFYAHESRARLLFEDNELIQTRGACPSGSRCRALAAPE